MFGFRSPLQEGHRWGVCYVYMYSATDGVLLFRGVHLEIERSHIVVELL